ncbi:MAG TPA: DUF2142 domain-containing protein [Thermoflexia bacterium]|jgi:4-amino-4-deoxy-L-arabinose transferase-like glycosyltransferase|nr:DUF2142 domain-containing protein [Thermoflexia bacterium]
MTHDRCLASCILLLYLLLAVLYAVYTPPWQVPDEPAHYNYIRTVAETGHLPVMEPGDYDQAYLERIVAAGFPPSLPIEPLTYEDHQPPLYYLLAAPIYLLFDGALLPLRLFSVLLGAGVLVTAWGVVRSLCPDRSGVALTVVGLIGFLPQHLAMMAGVNNDPLAELMVGASLWTAVRYVQGRDDGRRYLLGWGVLLGLTVLTKTTAYVALPVSLLAVGVRAWDEGERWRGLARRVGWLALPAALTAAPWLAHNAALYGWTDPLALARHNEVVVGQPRTAEWIAQYGWTGWAVRFLRTTFQSFWGQFGWMGVPFQPAVYGALALFSGLLAGGFLGWLLDRRRPALSEGQRKGAWVLLTSALLTTALYLFYNRTFVQHQGRYLFPALIPLALAGALGLDWLLSGRAALWAAGACGAVGLALGTWGVVRGDLPRIPMAAAFGLAGLLGLAAGPPRRRAAAQAVLVAGLAALALYGLFGAIVPTLR